MSKIELPDSVERIGVGAFEFCESATTVELPKRLSEIPAECFCGCISLKDIKIPKTVEKIGSKAFAFCVNLQKIDFYGTKEDWLAIKKSDDWKYESKRLKFVKCVNGILELK